MAAPSPPLSPPTPSPRHPRWRRALGVRLSAPAVRPAPPRATIGRRARLSANAARGLAARGEGREKSPRCPASPPRCQSPHPSPPIGSGADPSAFCRVYKASRAGRRTGHAHSSAGGGPNSKPALPIGQKRRHSMRGGRRREVPPPPLGQTHRGGAVPPASFLSHRLQPRAGEPMAAGRRGQLTEMPLKAERTYRRPGKAAQGPPRGRGQLSSRQGPPPPLRVPL